jgi:diphosphomevalonate decarboxylase
MYQSTWRSPSNIALIKYWGKHGVQLPRNPSLSFTLSACHTTMHMTVTPDDVTPGLTVLYDGQPRPAFVSKIQTFFSHIADLFPWIAKASIEIDSINTFPHGAGIASSASAMSAMSLCLMDIHDQITGVTAARHDAWWQKASMIARLGSGSASRSLFAVASLWGKTESVMQSSDEYAIPWKEEVAPIFHDYQDTILIVSASEKSVSSTSGHALMDTLPYANTRYEEAKKNMQRLLQCMKHNDRMEEFISICESEALQLHALMMSGTQPFILLEPHTITIIREVWRFRKETSIPVCFTLDAGPNVHLLYPASHKESVLAWINTSLLQFCSDGRFIADRVGNGPIKISPPFTSS